MVSNTPLFDAMTSWDGLHAGWLRVARNRGGPGGDGMTIGQFTDQLPERLTRLGLALRGRRYHPGPLRRVDIPKRSGGTRTLLIPCVADRIAQAAAVEVLTPLLDAEMEPASYAYRPGRGVRQAVDRISHLRRQGYTWVVDGDIERFFDSVRHDTLLARLGRSVTEAPVLDLVGQWLAGAAPDGRGIPQGSPLSPLLANLFLDDVDEAMEGTGAHLVRFADDFVILCRSEARAAGALARLAGQLDRLGLRLNPDKTRLVSFDEGFRFLGRLFVRSLVVESPEDDDPAPAHIPAPPPPPPETAEEAEIITPLADRDTPRRPVLRSLYLVEPGRRLSVRNMALTVRDGDRELLAVAPGRLDRVELGPGCAIDEDALAHLAAEGIRVDIVTGHGATLASLARPSAERAGLHLAQARICLDDGRRTALAAVIVEARMHNQRALLRRLNRTASDDAVADAARRIGRLRLKLPLMESVQRVMGVEGEAAALYWPALSRLLRHGASLPGRRRRPPTDPVNAVLSFVASLLERDLSAAIGREGLHPGFGALHTPRDDAQACVNDLMEEFRAPIAEALTVTLFNGRRLSMEMFSARDRDGAVQFDPEARKRIISGYEGWLQRPVVSPATGAKGTWRNLIADQVALYAEAALGDPPYVPYHMDY